MPWSAGIFLIIALLDDLFEKLSEGTDCADKSDVTNIWALGGSLKIPYFRKLLEDYFGSELFDAQNYDFEDMEEFSKGLENKYLVVAMLFPTVYAFLLVMTGYVKAWQRIRPLALKHCICRSILTTWRRQTGR